MAFKIKKSGAWADPSTFKRRAGGAWVNVQTVKRRVSGAWVTVWSSLSMTLSPTSINRSQTSALFTTNAVTATPTGGNGSYTYSWTWVSNPGNLNITTSTRQSTTFSKGGMVFGGTYQGLARCTVTSGGVSVYQDISISISRESNN